MSYISDIFNAGQTKRFSIGGKFFRLLSGPAAINIKFYRNRSLLDESVVNITTGFFFKDDIGFDEFEVYSASAQTLIFLASNGEVGFSDSVNVTGGSVLVMYDNVAFAQANPTVTNAAAQLVAANAARRYLMIQNKDASGSIYVNFGGTATVANGFKIPAGGTWEWNGVQSNQAISAIGDIASNANIVTVTG